MGSHMQELSRSAEKMTVVRFVHASRNALLADGVEAGRVKDPTKALEDMFHDAYCRRDDTERANPYFNVRQTPDGEPFVDWIEQTPEEWSETILGILTRHAVDAVVDELKDMLGMKEDD